MDIIDKKIATHLQKNAQITHREIGIEIDLPTSTVNDRVRHLIKNGTIKHIIKVSSKRIENAIDSMLLTTLHIKLKETKAIIAIVISDKIKTICFLLYILLLAKILYSVFIKLLISTSQ